MIIIINNNNNNNNNILYIRGECHREVVPFLFGGRLIALEKKSGGVRPKAIGYTRRKIAAKCANTFSP